MNSIAEFSQSYPSKSFEPKTIMINPDDTLSFGYYLKEGSIRQYNLSLEGSELTIHIFPQGSLLPLPQLLNDIPNRYYFETITQVKVHVIPKKEIASFLESHPQELMNLTKRLLDGLDKLSLRVELLASTDALERTIMSLIYLCRRFGLQEKNVVVLGQKFTHADIAAFAGLSRETVSRQWKKLEQDALVSQQHHIITIHDLHRLETLLKKP